MIEQEPCKHCFNAIEREWSNCLVCRIDEKCYLGKRDCEHFFNKSTVHEKAEHFRKMINSLTDEQLAFMYLH